MLTKITSHPFLKLFIKLSLLLFCLVFIKTKLSYEFSHFLETIYRLNIGFLFLSLISLLLSFLLGAYKWKMLFNTFHAKSQFSDFLNACFNYHILLFNLLINYDIQFLDLHLSFEFIDLDVAQLFLSVELPFFVHVCKNPLLLCNNAN